MKSVNHVEREKTLTSKMLRIKIDYFSLKLSLKFKPGQSLFSDRRGFAGHNIRLVSLTGAKVIEDTETGILCACGYRKRKLDRTRRNEN